MIRLACLVRAHRRVDTLRVVLDQLSSYRYAMQPAVVVDVLICGDRMTDEVKALCDEYPFEWVNWPEDAILSPKGERFLTAQNVHLDALECNYETPDWVYVVDDDFALDLDGAARLPEQLARTDADAFYMRVLFVEDDHDTQNAARTHNSIRLYRHRPGARFSGKRMLSVPDELHDEYIITDRVKQYPGKLLEYGGFTAEDRARTFEAYRAAGKVDDFTLALTPARRLLHPLPPGLKNPFRALERSGP